MNFWDMHDLALIQLRQEAIKIIENVEGKNVNNKSPTNKIQKVLNEELKEKTSSLTKYSISTTLKNLYSPE